MNTEKIKSGRKPFAPGMKKERLQVLVEGRMIERLGGRGAAEKWCALQIISEWERLASLEG